MKKQQLAKRKGNNYEVGNESEMIVE